MGESVKGVGRLISKGFNRINKSPVSVYVVLAEETQFSITRNVDIDADFWTIRNLDSGVTTKLKGGGVFRLFKVYKELKEIDSKEWLKNAPMA